MMSIWTEFWNKVQRWNKFKKESSKKGLIRGLFATLDRVTELMYNVVYVVVTSPTYYSGSGPQSASSPVLTRVSREYFKQITPGGGMSRKTIVVEWSCRVDNPECPLQAEFGTACQRSISHRTCHRPASTIPGGYAAMSRIFVARKFAGANDSAQRAA